MSTLWKGENRELALVGPSKADLVVIHAVLQEAGVTFVALTREDNLITRVRQVLKPSGRPRSNEWRQTRHDLSRCTEQVIRQVKDSGLTAYGYDMVELKALIPVTEAEFDENIHTMEPAFAEADHNLRFIGGFKLAELGDPANRAKYPEGAGRLAVGMAFKAIL
jgi:hypothetical protein